MSLAHIQTELMTRTGRDILPENLPIDVLICLLRQLAYLEQGMLMHADVLALRNCMHEMTERLLAMQCVNRLPAYRENHEQLLPKLLTELDWVVRNELVSRVIGHNVVRPRLDEAFGEYFETL